MVYPGVLQRIKTDFTAESAEGIHAETGVAIYEFFNRARESQQRNVIHTQWPRRAFVPTSSAVKKKV